MNVTQLAKQVEHQIDDHLASGSTIDPRIEAARWGVRIHTAIEALTILSNRGLIRPLRQLTSISPEGRESRYFEYVPVQSARTPALT